MQKVLSYEFAKVAFVIALCFASLHFTVSQYRGVWETVHDKHMDSLKFEVEQLRTEMGEHCAKVPEIESQDDDGEHVSYFSFIFVLSSLSLIGHFLIKEAIIAKRTMDKETNVNFTYLDLFAYRIDYWFSSSAAFKPLALLAATFMLILCGAILLQLFAGQTFAGGLWLSWTFVADPGNHAGESENGARAVAFLLTIGGMLVFALVIGIVAEEISEKVDDLRKGKSSVAEANHTLLLGWSDKIIPIIKELCNANESEGGGTIVILAERDKLEMEEDVKEGVPDTLGTRVIVRSGSPIVMSDLHKVAVRSAKSIIVLAMPDVSADESDAHMVRIMLSLIGMGTKKGHVVCELQDVDNRELVQLVGKSQVETMVAHDIIGRLMIQCACNPGLSAVMECLLGFEGSEFYLEHWPQTVGKTFGEVMFMFDEAVPLGYMRPGQEPVINPPDSCVIREGDEILVLAEDNDTYSVVKEKHPLQPLPRITWTPTPLEPQNILFCGWRRDMDDMIKELDAMVPKGSKLWLMNTVAMADRKSKLMEDGRTGEEGLQNVDIVHAVGNPTLRRHLECIPLQVFDSVLILADESESTDMETADSRSLASLLLCRDIRNQRLREHHSTPPETPRGGRTRGRGTVIESGDLSHEDRLSNDTHVDRVFTLISEVLDPRTRALIAHADVSDFVMSNEIVSSAMAQVAERREMNSVLNELLTSVGNEVYLREVQLYALIDEEEVTFWDLVNRGRARGEVVIGWKRCGEGPIINPPDKNLRRRWVAGDMVAVIAED